MIPSIRVLLDVDTRGSALLIRGQWKRTVDNGHDAVQSHFSIPNLSPFSFVEPNAAKYSISRSSASLS